MSTRAPNKSVKSMRCATVKVFVFKLSMLYGKNVITVYTVTTNEPHVTCKRSANIYLHDPAGGGHLATHFASHDDIRPLLPVKKYKLTQPTPEGTVVIRLKLNDNRNQRPLLDLTSRRGHVRTNIT